MKHIYLRAKGILFVGFLIGLMMMGGKSWGQAALTSGGTAVVDNLNSYMGTSTLPTNWTTSGSGANGNNFSGNNQVGGTSGGWYGNGNMSYLGSGTATNGNATWKLVNNTGSTITSFDLSFAARMWKSGGSSPVVTVSYSTNNTGTVPAAGLLTSIGTFSDGTPSIATGTTLSYTISSISIPNGDYLYIRFIHAGNSTSDNLGWDDVSVTPTVSAPTPLATISDNGTQIGTQNIYSNNNDNLISKAKVVFSNGPVTITSMSFTAAATSTYLAADITGFKLYRDAAATFNTGTATAIGSPISSTRVSGTETITFSTSQTSLSNGTYYYYLVADIPSTATSGRIINIASFNSITVTGGSSTGSASAAGATTILGPPVVTGSSQAGATGTAFSYTVVATNNPTTYTLASGTLPPGLTLTAATGVIAGTPTSAGTYSITVTATNPAGVSTAATINFVISLSTYALFDDFNRSNNDALSIPSSGGVIPWSEVETATTQTVINNNRLDLLTNISTSGVTYDYFDMNGKYTTTFANANKALTWFFNMRITRANPSGFNAGNYGMAFILGSSSSNLSTGGTGYAVIFGETGTPDNVKLVKFTGGVTGTQTVIVTNALTPTNDLINCRVDYNPCTGSWTLAVNDGGAAGSSAFNFADPIGITYASSGSATDNTYTSSNLRYLGALFNYSNGAGEFASFDNISIPNDLSSASSYTWNGTTTDYQVATNWTPTRTCPKTTDILDFSVASPATSTVTNVPTQTIGQVLVSGNRTVTFKDVASDAAASTLTIGGGTGADLSVAAGSSFIFDVASSNNSNDALVLNLLTGTTASISGTVIFRNSNSGTAARPHQLLSADASSITINNGGIIKAEDLSGDPFGGSGTANVVNFLSGSVYESGDGSAPFGLSQPSSKVVFNSGSTYRHKQNSIPSLFGRTYANFEFDMASYTANINLGSAATFTVDTLKVLNGTMNLTGSASTSVNTTIKGDLLISAGAAYNYNPSQASTISFAGSTAPQKINNAGTISFGTLATVEVNNTYVSNAKLSVETDISIGGILKVTAGNLNLSTGNISMLSTATSTASIAAVNGSVSYGTGQFIIEKYIKTLRKWQFLSPDATSGSNTFQTDWMEGQSTGTMTATGYGMWVTGSNGMPTFDDYTATPTIKWWDGSAYNGISTVADPIHTYPAYMTYIRGDRGSSGPVTGANTFTVLRTKGQIHTGNYPSTATHIPTLAGYFALGNPYASVIDLRSISTNAPLNTPITIMVWDPQLAGYGYGAFQTLTGSQSGGFTISPGLGSYGVALNSPMNFIESGQAFFVQSAGVDLDIQFNEAAKNTYQHTVSFTAGQAQSIGGQLFAKNNGVNDLADGFLVKFDQGYSNNADYSDARKMLNTNENISIKKQNTLLAVELRQPVDETDTIRINMANMRAVNYHWDIIAENMDQPGRVAFLSDKFLGTLTSLDLAAATGYDFSVTADPATYAADRFMIIFKQAAILPVTLNSISATRLNDQSVLVNWNAENELNIHHYEIERSATGNNFTQIGLQTPTNNAGAAAAYAYTDAKAGKAVNYYRVKAISNNGQVQYSHAVKVDGITNTAGVLIYPNPVTDHILHIEMNKQPAGKYAWQLLNSDGKEILTGSFDIQGSGSVNEVNLPLGNNAAAGTYMLKLTGPDGYRSVQKVSVK